jgi:hypothetical protein
LADNLSGVADFRGQCSMFAQHLDPNKKPVVKDKTTITSSLSRRLAYLTGNLPDVVDAAHIDQLDATWPLDGLEGPFIQDKDMVLAVSS